MDHATRTPSMDLGRPETAPVGEERRRAVASVCVHALLATPAGSHIDREKLAAYVEARLERWFDGQRFDATPLVGSLVAIDGVTERDLYVGIVNLMGALAGMGVDMAEPELALSIEERRRLMQQARAATEGARASFERRRLKRALADLERQKLGGLMVARGLISASQLVAALSAQEQHGGRLGTNLVEMGFVTPAELAHFLSEQLDLPCVTSIGHVPPEILGLVPADVASRHRVFPIDVEDEHLVLAMADPGNIIAVEEVEAASGRPVRPTIAPELMITYALARHYHVRQASRVRQLPVGGEPALAAPGYDERALANDLARADDRYDVLAMVQHYLADRFRVSAVFDVAENVVRGFCASGTEGDALDIRDWAVPLTDEIEDAWFAEALGVDEIIQLAVVTVDGAPSAILVGCGGAFDGQETARLTSLASAAIRMVELREEILASRPAELIDHVPETGALRFEVALGVLGAANRADDPPRHADAVVLEALDLVRVVREEGDALDAEVVQDVGRHLVAPQVRLEPEPVVRVDRVDALRLQRVRLDLVPEADAAPFLPQVHQHACAGLLDRVQRGVELALAVALERTEHLGGDALAVDANQHVLFARITVDQRDVLAFLALAVHDAPRITVLGGNGGLRETHHCAPGESGDPFLRENHGWNSGNEVRGAEVTLGSQTEPVNDA